MAKKDLGKKGEKAMEARKVAYEAKRNPEREDRAKKVAALASQMKARGIDVDSMKDPGVVKQIGRFVTDKHGKPYVTMAKSGKGVRFGSLVKKIMTAAHGILTGTHQDVSKGRRPVTGEAKKANIPIGAAIKRYKTKADFENSDSKKK